jgi:hypothetical protein
MTAKSRLALDCGAVATLSNSRPLETRWHTTPIVTPESIGGHSKEESVQFPVRQWMVCEN